MNFHSRRTLSSTSSGRTTMDGGKGSWTAWRGSSPATMWSPACSRSRQPRSPAMTMLSARHFPSNLWFYCSCSWGSVREKRFELQQSFVSEIGTVELLHWQHWGKLLKDGVQHLWAFLSAQMPSWTELNILLEFLGLMPMIRSDCSFQLVLKAVPTGTLTPVLMLKNQLSKINEAFGYLVYTIK